MLHFITCSNNLFYIVRQQYDTLEVLHQFFPYAWTDFVRMLDEKLLEQLNIVHQGKGCFWNGIYIILIHFFFGLFLLAQAESYIQGNVVWNFFIHFLDRFHAILPVTARFCFTCSFNLIKKSSAGCHFFTFLKNNVTCTLIYSLDR